MNDTQSRAEGSEPGQWWTESKNVIPTLIPNITHENEDGSQTVAWYRITEAVLLGIVTLVGLIGNSIVMRGSLRAKRFAKQNVYLFFGLSLSDFFVCLIRSPSLVFIMFHTVGSHDVICELWMFSGIFVFIGIFMNMILAIERRMIMYNFQGYLSHFTPKRVFYITIIIWTSVPLVFVAVYVGFLFRASFHGTDLSCYLQTNLIPMYMTSSTVFRVITLCAGGFVPICVKAVCYVSIVIKVYKAELLKLDRINEKATYSRIIRIAFARVLLIITCVLPVLICFAIGPVFPEVYYANVRFLDYLLILRSMISPLITMHDTDFRESLVRRKWRYCSTFKSHTSSKKGSRRSYITSAELKTIGQA